MRLPSMLTIAAAAFLPACTDAGVGPTECTPSATQICMTSSLTFNPSSLTVASGTEVTWRDGSDTPHTVTSDPSATESFDADISGGGTFSRTFNTAGSYPYHCELHSGMTGTVTVSP
jgi:plastocyanin